MQKEENISKRESQSMALLEKLIRLDSKDCNFHFKDDFRGAYFKVSYPQTSTDNNSNEGLLRQLWHHIWAHYFKQLQQEEIKRLDYVKAVLANPFPHSLSSSPFSQRLPATDQLFLAEMDALYRQSYLRRLSQEVAIDREAGIWLKSLYLNTKIATLTEWLGKQERKKSKIIYSKLKQSRKHRKILKTKKAIMRAIEEDEEAIQDYLQELEQIEQQRGTQIDKEIYKLQRELDDNVAFSSSILERIEGGMRQEQEEAENRGQYRNFMTNSSQFSQDNSKDLECLEYLIKCLEEKQIAESVAKIISTERASGEIMFQLSYEKAINIEPKLVSEKELSRINFLRETSLLQFYRTGVKSPYSYICHNYVGFRELMQSRLNITARLKDKCILQMMKKGACLASLAQIQHEMTKFNTCHHCKFLYPDYLLFTCKFASDKQAIPKINLEAICDPNLVETCQEGPNKNRSSQRFMTRKKNCLTSYAKIHDEYVCGRKYCFSCLKDTYIHENIRENGLCPFCLGACICTRCLRNEKIARFKNMYSLLGGDLARIQEGSELEQLQAKGEELVQRGRGRPKKYAISHTTVNITQKKLRKFDEKENYAVKGLLGKKKRQNNPQTKRNDSGNDTQQQIDPKRKKKRGVGRPRTDKVQIWLQKKYVPMQ